jgi:hypothetical protein
MQEYAFTYPYFVRVAGFGVDLSILLDISKGMGRRSS